jgi:hypothetical protein
MENISLLIGSGFSKPAGFPTTSKINERLKKIDVSAVCKHTSGATWFLNDDADPNSHWMGIWERNFIQEFIQFYNDRVLTNGEEFHYEFFYDYYHEHMVNDNYPDDLSSFMQDFTRKYDLDKNAHDLLFQFDLCYNQLIADLLGKQFKRSCLAKPYHPSCDKFLHLVEILSQRFIVNLHSLNHDLYLEYLSHSDSIQSNMDDGFDEFNSPYFGKFLTDNERYMVRLSRFTDKFVQPFRLFKLHGSIDRYWFKGNDNTELIRLKFGLGKTDVYKEVIEDGQYKYEDSPLYYYPDFLSGTTYKTRRYSKGSYYPTIFNHFEKNLRSSDYLIIIGFGFGDSVIENKVKDSFLTSNNKTIFIVDIKQPRTNLLKHPNVFYIPGGVVGMDNKFILNKIGM